ncbi:hypothetical protein JY458_03845 [Stenotrophomonas maltophilia]|nr:hypothetical protein [Stenotrophomonas maltophilia]
MKYHSSCPACSQGKEDFDIAPITVEYFDTLGGTYKCRNGHERYAVIQGPKFQVLMASGAEALFAGFTLEACTTFSAATERFYECMLKAMLLKSGLTEELIELQFKEMSRQSERQLGAFMSQYAIHTGTAFVPSKKLTERRNEYVHKAVVPNHEAAMGYCSDVYDQILKCVLILKPLLLEELQKVVVWETRQSRSKAPLGSEIELVASPGIFSLLSDSFPSFKESMEHYQTVQGFATSLGDIPQETVAMIREQRLAQERRDSGLSEGISP